MAGSVPLLARGRKFPVLIILLGVAALITFTAADALTRKQILSALKLDALAKKKLGAKCKKKKLRASAHSQCDLDRDGLTNQREFLLRTNRKKIDTDSDGLTDRIEVVIYGTSPRKADTDGDGLSDGAEINIYGLNPLKQDSDDDGILDGEEVLSPPAPNACPTPNFNGNGETAAFGIPVPNLGRISRGEALYTARCFVCHPLRDHGVNLNFSDLKTRIAAPPMMITNLSTAQLADLVAYLNQSQLGGGPCELTPTPQPNPTGSPNSPTPTSTPYIPPTPCAGGNFNSNGNTTSGAFQIPTNLTGNISLGNAKYSASCGSGGCHGSTVRGIGYTFPQLRSAVTSPPMSLTIVDQDVANLVAYLNQTNVGGCSTPAATPTPVSDFTRGFWVYGSTCQSCHHVDSQGRPDHDLWGLSSRQLRGAIRDKSEMRSIVLTAEQERVLLIYLGTFN